MNEKPSDARPRLKRRWTLGGLMILIALIALPTAVIVQQRREIELMRLEAEHARAQAVAALEQAQNARVGFRGAISNQAALPPPLAAPPNQADPR
jgi:hypothetical protein